MPGLHRSDTRHSEDCVSRRLEFHAATGDHADCTCPQVPKPVGAQTCAECGCWTGVPVTREAVLSEWRWIEDDDGDIFCEECQ